ncbi:hypothetical protein GEU84_000615 [Fertoebacter nigrum]|uniref:Calcium-binding protein n=1 Tax=Fertoeibacter niger TaxID=2656921 RepID=A0A8X8GR95_9RHOB|nr:calcium-binding protein [Fertoeibacter niger]NUB42873.1 hypothetical protein [Fertoeibacter niger]
MARNPVPGSSGPDLLDGTLRSDRITGLEGDDTIFADAGHDVAFGDQGLDLIFGGAGFDTLYGGDDDDTLSGDDGDDLLHGGAGFDVLEGGSGNDTVYGAAGDDVFFGGEGEDWYYGGDGSDFILTGDFGYGGVNHAFGGDGDDFIAISVGGEGGAHGGAGVDVLLINWYDNFNGGGDIEIRLTGPDAGATGDGLTLDISGMEILVAFTYTGNDTVIGGQYGDDISVQLGANTVLAMEGDDRVTYATGAVNLLDGGDGDDLLVLSHAPSTALVFTVSGSQADDGHGSTIRNFEHYAVQGYFAADVIQLGSGDDFALGNGGNDSLSGFDGDDYLNGGTQDDVLDGGGGADTLLGDRGNDTLFGGDGADILRGGKGRDDLFGGAGADQFRMAIPLFEAGSLAETDIIHDFELGLDRVTVNNAVVGTAFASGALDAALFHFDGPVGTAAQFYLEELASGDVFRLILDMNGTDADGAAVLADLQGAHIAGMTAADIFIL